MTKLIPEQEQQIKFLENRKVLIMDTSTSKITIRKIMSQMGTKATNLDLVDNYTDAFEALHKSKHEILWTDYKIESDVSKNGFDLYKDFKQIHPNRLETIFILMSDNNSAALASRAAEEDCDAFLVRPFTFEVIEKKICDILKAKVQPTDYTKMVETAKMMIEQKKWDEANVLIDKAFSLDPTPALAHYYKGVIQKNKQDIDGAEKSFETAVQLNKEHYKSIAGIFEIKAEKKQYQVAYEIALRLFRDFPANPRYIPKLIWLAVYHKKFEDILSFYDAFSVINPLDDVAITSVAAGMIICGKELLTQKQILEAVEVFKKADTISKSKPSIIREIITSFLNAGADKLAQPYYTKTTIEVRNSIEVLLAEIHQMVNTNVEPINIMTRCQDALKLGHKHQFIYETMIKYSVVLKRSNSIIDDLVSSASVIFPDKKIVFEKLAKG